MTAFVVAKAFAATAHSSFNIFDPYFPAEHNALLDQAVISPVSFVEPASHSGPICSSSSNYWLDQQDHTGTARGYAPFLPGDYTYPIYRDVKSYHAVGDCNADDTHNLQMAINDDGKGGNRYNDEVINSTSGSFCAGRDL